MDIYNRIDEIISERHMSRRALAQQIGVAPSTLQSMMARKRGITFDILMRITEVLQISPNEFYTCDSPDREYETLCNSLNKAGLSIEATGFGLGPDESGDMYYVWHADAESPEEDRVELTYTDLSRIISSIEKDAEDNKQRYVQQRLDIELFSPWLNKKPLQS